MTWRGFLTHVAESSKWQLEQASDVTPLCFTSAFRSCGDGSAPDAVSACVALRTGLPRSGDRSHSFLCPQRREQRLLHWCQRNELDADTHRPIYRGRGVPDRPSKMDAAR